MMAKKRRQYSAVSLDRAVDSVKKKQLTSTQAAKVYGVPRKTIDHRVKGLVNIFSRPGPNPMLSPDEENHLVNYLDYTVGLGFRINNRMIRKYVIEMMAKSGKKSLFKENGPSNKWIFDFFKRHPDLKSYRGAKGGVVAINEKDNDLTNNDEDDDLQSEDNDGLQHEDDNEPPVNRYFSLLVDTITSLALNEKPSQIFNVGGANFSLDDFLYLPTRTENASSNEQTNVVANICISAAGRLLPTMVTFPKVLPHKNHQDGLPHDWLLAESESGCIDINGNLFNHWFHNLFLPHCGTGRPVLLTIESQGSRLGSDVVGLKLPNDIKLLCIPPYSTRSLQPLQCGIFKPLKAKFKSLSSSVNVISSIQKADFSFVLSHCLDEVCSPARVKTSFRKTGIFPLNYEAVAALVVPSTEEETNVLDSEDQSTGNKSTADNHSCQHCGNFLVNSFVLDSLALVQPKVEALDE